MPRAREKSQAWWHWGGRGRQILGAWWLVSPAYLMNARPVKDSKTKYLVMP